MPIWSILHLIEHAHSLSEKLMKLQVTYRYSRVHNKLFNDFKIQYHTDKSNFTIINYERPS